MNSAEFVAIAKQIDDEASTALRTKGEDSPVNDDRLSNFTATAEIASLILNRDVTPAEVAVIFFIKHFIPLVKFAEGTELVSEPPLGRAADAQNYIKLMYAIGAETLTDTRNDATGGTGKCTVDGWCGMRDDLCWCWGEPDCDWCRNASSGSAE